MTSRPIALFFLFLGTAGAQIEAGPQVWNVGISANPVHWAAAATFVSAADLSMPSNAKKEFENANRSIAKHDWTTATERLRRGLAIYPGYAAGYNNLGAIYSQLGKSGPAYDALEKAIALDNRLVPAYINLGRLYFLESDYPTAESLISHAMSLAPPVNLDELLLLAYAQFNDDHLKQVAETSRLGHKMQISNHGILHLLAAKALERQGMVSDSVAELESYLSEEPTGDRADKVRAILPKLQAKAGLQ